MGVYIGVPLFWESAKYEPNMLQAARGERLSCPHAGTPNLYPLKPEALYLPPCKKVVPDRSTRVAGLDPGDAFDYARVFKKQVFLFGGGYL